MCTCTIAASTLIQRVASSWYRSWWRTCRRNNIETKTEAHWMVHDCSSAVAKWVRSLHSLCTIVCIIETLMQADQIRLTLLQSLGYFPMVLFGYHQWSNKVTAHNRKAQSCMNIVVHTAVGLGLHTDISPSHHVGQETSLYCDSNCTVEQLKNVQFD